MEGGEAAAEHGLQFFPHDVELNFRKGYALFSSFPKKLHYK